MSQSFNIGDEVHHKSGGPKMIVCAVLTEDQTGSSETIGCERIDLDGKRHTEYFHPETLKPYTPPSRPRRVTR